MSLWLSVRRHIPGVELDDEAEEMFVVKGHRDLPKHIIFS